MSDVLWGALIGSLAAVGGATVTQVGNVLMERQREHAAYRVNLYSRRLEAHQRAFEIAQRLGAIAHTMSPNDSLRQPVTEASSWYNANVLYLDPISIHEFTQLIANYHEWVSGKLPKTTVADQVDSVHSALIKGIGLKHIDWSSIKDDIKLWNQKDPGS